MYGIYEIQDDIRQDLDRRSLPASYPRPDKEDMILYIQRSYNTNTVIYLPNYDLSGYLNTSKPLNIYWQRFEEGGVVYPINYLQERLIYGYQHKQINNEAWELTFHAKPEEKFYLAKIDGRYRLVQKKGNEQLIINHIYAFTENHGVFPNIKILEYYGQNISDHHPTCYRIKY